MNPSSKSGAPDASIHFRAVRPDDKDALLRGLAAMSARSRYLRFGSARTTFSDAELRYLTEVDGLNHHALLAFACEGDREVEAGAGRFIRIRGQPEVAEVALTVMDAFQRRGIGKQLLALLAHAAVERGIRWFECEFLSENLAVRNLIRSVAPDAVIEHTGFGQMKARIPIRAL